MRSTAVLRPLQLTCLLTNQQTQTWQNTPTKFPNFLLSRWFCDSIASFAYSRKWMPTKNTLQVNRASLNRPRIATRGLFVSTSRRIFSLKVKVAAAQPWRHFFPASPTVGLSSDSGNSSGSRSGNGEAQCDRNRLRRKKTPNFSKTRTKSWTDLFSVGFGFRLVSSEAEKIRTLIFFPGWISARDDISRPKRFPF